MSIIWIQVGQQRMAIATPRRLFCPVITFVFKETPNFRFRVPVSACVERHLQILGKAARAGVEIACSTICAQIAQARTGTQSSGKTTIQPNCPPIGVYPRNKSPTVLSATRKAQISYWVGSGFVAWGTQFWIHLGIGEVGVPRKMKTD